MIYKPLHICIILITLFFTFIRINNLCALNDLSDRNRSIFHYDSLSNYVENPLVLIGQKLIVPELSNELKANIGYTGFYSDYLAKTVYKADSLNPHTSKPKFLSKKRLKIIDVIHTNNNEYFLKLENSNQEILYYQYPKKEENWMCIIEGYYEKLDAKFSGSSFIIRKDITLNDYKYNKPLIIKKGEQMTVKALFIRRPEEFSTSTICMILMLPDKNHILIPYNCVDINCSECEISNLSRTAIWLGYFDEPDVRKKNWGYIIDEKLRAGMFPLECALAIGQPIKIEEVQEENYNSQIWYYTNKTLVFIDGLLDKINTF